MKKLLSITLSMVMLCTMITSYAITAKAAVSDAVTVTLALKSDKKEAKIGDTINVSVVASNIKDVSSIELYISYDQSKFEYIKSEVGKAMTIQNPIISHNALTKYDVQLTAMSATEKMTDSIEGGSILEIQFKVKDVASGASDFKVSTQNTTIIMDAVGNDINPTYEEIATVTIKGTLNSITLNKDILTLDKGQTEELKIIKNPENAAGDIALAEWKIDDTSIATVNGGVVTGIKYGTTKLLVTLNGKTAECKVIVQKNSDKTEPPKEDNNGTNEKPLTADSANVMVLIAIMIIAAVASILLTLKRKSK